jgi:hypothetical protein
MTVREAQPEERLLRTAVVVRLLEYSCHNDGTCRGVFLRIGVVITASRF